MKKFFILFLLIFFISGCNNASKNSDTISYQNAKEKIINEGALMVEVGTIEEYNEKHISGASFLDFNEINEDTVKEIIDNKNNIIILYSKDGKKSKKALYLLNSLGYSNVYDFGSIDNWKE